MRKPLLLVAFLVALLAGPATAMAQTASPAAGSPTADTSLLAGLGYPELVITTDGADFEAPAEIAAGRYRLVVVNTSEARPADIELYQIPEDMTFEEVQEAFAAADPEAESAPDIFFEIGIAGGVSTEAASQSDVVVDLTPGSWGFNLFSEGEEGVVNLAKEVVVTGEMPALEDPQADVDVSMIEMAFEMPDVVPAGPSIWKVSNGGAFPHFTLIESYPEPLTREAIEATLAAAFGIPATPAANGTPVAMLDPEQFTEVGGTLVLSTGNANWIEVDLAPGEYVVFCFVSGPGDVPIHAALGMFKIITVE